MTDPVPSNSTCPVCETPDGDHLDWCTPQAREHLPSKELAEAIAAANRQLDEPFADPDDDIRTVARQFLRSIEGAERLRTTLRGIASCSTCEACRGAATLALSGAEPEPAPALTERVPHDVAVRILRVRDLMAKREYDEAYHVLYGIADPTYTSFMPWAELERTAQPPPPAEWQPIEIAPKDGTPILGYVLPPRMQSSLEGPRVVKWAGEYGMWSMPGISGLTCSHWMPLPTRPAQPPGVGQ